MGPPFSHRKACKLPWQIPEAPHHLTLAVDCKCHVALVTFDSSQIRHLTFTPQKDVIFLIAGPITPGARNGNISHSHNIP